MSDRELDARVAEKVMGLDISKYPIEHEKSNYPESRSIEYWVEDIPHYSTSIAAAWKVVERMRDNCWGFRMGHEPENIGGRLSLAFVGAGVEAEETSEKGAPRAICLAALKAVGSGGRSKMIGQAAIERRNPWQETPCPLCGLAMIEIKCKLYCPSDGIIGDCTDL